MLLRKKSMMRRAKTCRQSFCNTDRESSSLAIKNGGGVVSLYDPDVGKVRNVYFLVRYISSNVATDEDKGRE